MKITNTKYGESYQLTPGTQIEIERPNLFFNEWGEQSTPVELPDTDQNRKLCGYPDMLGNLQRPRADIECTIQDGNFFQPARQAILGAKRKESITTTLYLNEGCFLAKVDETLVSEIFGEETIPGIETVEQAIDFCRKLARNEGDYTQQYAIFPVLLDGDATSDDGNTVYRYLNRYGKTDVAGFWQDTSYVDVTGWDFYNAVDRSEKNGDETIQVPAGFYITPFIKANYLLNRILQHFGYTLLESFFTRTAPFTEMVFVSNCCDALVKGQIRLSDLVPDCTCGDILNVFRKKFCCEFITDEVNRTATIVLMNDVLELAPQENLTQYLTGYPLIEVPESYKRITLQSDDVVEGDVDNPQTLETMLANYKNLYYDVVRNACYRQGYQMEYGNNGTYYQLITRDYTSTATQNYDTGESLDVEEVQVPDKQLCFRKASPNATAEPPTVSAFEALYIGGGKYINSNLIPSEGESEIGEVEETSTDNEDTRPMLAYHYHQYGYPHGTIGTTVNKFLGQEKLWDYALSYVGPDGIFEKFYRKLDALYRNSLLSVTAELLLPDRLKQSLKAHQPVILDGQKLLPEIIHFVVGGKNEPVESTFRTMRLYEPVSEAAASEVYARSTGETELYKWVPKQSQVEITKEQYESSSVKDRKPFVIYPNHPSEVYADGQRHYQQSADVIEKPHGGRYLHFDFWLECQKV